MNKTNTKEDVIAIIQGEYNISQGTVKFTALSDNVQNLLSNDKYGFTCDIRYTMDDLPPIVFYDY